MRSTTTIMLAGLALAGCGDSQPTQPANPIVVRSEAQDQLHQLNDMNRDIALRRAIFDSGATCQRVEESGYVQEWNNMSMWTARCSDRRQWAIFVAPDGTAQLRGCSTMEELGLPACVIRNKESAAESKAPGDAAAQDSAP